MGTQSREYLDYTGEFGGVWGEAISGGRSGYAAAKNTIALRAARAIGGDELAARVREMILRRRAYELDALMVSQRRWQSHARRARAYARRGYSPAAVAESLATRDRYVRAIA